MPACAGAPFAKPCPILEGPERAEQRKHGCGPGHPAKTTHSATVALELRAAGAAKPRLIEPRVGRAAAGL